MTRGGARTPLIDFSRYYFSLFCGLLFQGLSACSTSPDVQPVYLEDALHGPDVVAFDYETSRGGVIVFELDLPETGVGPFVLDTGATTSVLFKSAILPDTIMEEGTDVRIHDMNFHTFRPTAIVRRVSMGSREFTDVSFAILEIPYHGDTLLNQTKGIIGLDILKEYRVMIDPVDRKLHFIDGRSPPLKFDKSWAPIKLNERPFNQDVLGLHFLDLHVNGTDASAMLDTGSEFNVMNWNFRHLRKLRVRFRDLRKKWKVNGAVGDFSPEWSVVLEGIEFGRHAWSHQLFSVYRLGLFDTVNLEDKPMMIVGMPFFEGRTLLIDFENDVMWIKMVS